MIGNEGTIFALLMTTIGILCLALLGTLILEFHHRKHEEYTKYNLNCLESGQTQKICDARWQAGV